MTFIYALITVVGLIGNIVVCVVVMKNKVMHTATNYYLCSMAISDLLLLVTGIPHELFILWIRRPYLFGFYFCIIRGLAAETSTNATILTIVAFTIERYIGICHPLRIFALSNLKRVVKFILVIWVLAILSAIPQVIQYGIDKNGDCTVVYPIPHTFQASTLIFFFIPMTLISVLYIKIGLELTRSQQLNRRVSTSVRSCAANATSLDRSRGVIKMLSKRHLKFMQGVHYISKPNTRQLISLFK
ncbi:UNVERIFIED_CONTAM: hypothetical protein GTU68_065062 [Idotea baltica]|nr:hypothetical protein [Idotea baltica]